MQQINLRTLHSLKDYTNPELKLLASVAPARPFRTGDHLCREGEFGSSAFLIAIGRVAVTCTTPEGSRVLAPLDAGAIVGQMALIDHAPRTASVVAVEPTVALELTREVFEQQLRASSPLALRFQEQIAIAGIRQLRIATKRLVQLRTQPIQPSGPTERQRSQWMTLQASLTDWDVDPATPVQDPAPANSGAPSRNP